LTENVKCVACLVQKVQLMLAEPGVHFASAAQAAYLAATGYDTAKGSVRLASFQVNGTSLCAAHAHAAYSRYEITED
jgi:hypothetical protein